MRVIIVLAVLLTAVACKHELNGDKVFPAIKLNTPIDDQHFVTGDTIRINAVCTDDTEVDEVGVSITDDDTDVEFFHNHYGLIHSNTYTLNIKYPVTTLTTTKYIIEIHTSDAAGHTVEKDIEVRIN